MAHSGLENELASHFLEKLAKLVPNHHLSPDLRLALLEEEIACLSVLASLGRHPKTVDTGLTPQAVAFNIKVDPVWPIRV